MAKKAYLIPDLSSVQLKARYLSTLDRVESRRNGIRLWLVSEKWTIKEAASRRLA